MIVDIALGHGLLANQRPCSDYGNQWGFDSKDLPFAATQAMIRRSNDRVTDELTRQFESWNN